MTEGLPATPRPRRVGLWLALFIVLLIGLAGLIVGEKWRRHAEFVDRVRVLGGEVEARPAGPAWLRQALGEKHMRGWDPITGVNLADKSIDDAWLQGARPHLQDLEWIDVTNTAVTTDGLGALSALPKLKEVYIKETSIAEADLAQFSAEHSGLSILRGRKAPLATRMAKRTIHVHALICAAFSPGDGLLAVGDGEGQVHLWDVARRRLVRTIRAHEDWAFDVEFSPDGATLLTGGGDNRVRRWSVETGELIDEYAGHTGDVHGIEIAPDGRTLVTTSDDKTIHIVDAATLEPKSVLTGHTGTIPALALSPDGVRIASGSRDDTIRLWDVATGEALAVLDEHTGDVHAVAYSPDGRWLASASYDGTVRLRDAIDGATICILEGHTDWVFTAAFSPDSATLASGSGDGTVRLWDVRTGETQHALSRQKTVSRLAWSHNGGLLASAAADGNVGLWDTSENELLALLRAPAQGTAH